MKLGINIDHVATLRQARGVEYPDIAEAARAAERGGADSITIHLREDRRHIRDADLPLLAGVVQTRINLECAVTDEMLAIAEAFQPADVCLVPERREELTTEGGLDVRTHQEAVARAVRRLAASGSRVSLFVDPDPAQLQASRDCGARVVELHTGAYAEAPGGDGRAAELERLRVAVLAGQELGLTVHAGHGLHYENVAPVAQLAGIEELNIGHAVVCRAVFCGLEQAVRDMRLAIDQALARR